MGNKSVIGREEGRNGSAFVVLDEPKRLGMVGRIEDLKVIQAVMDLSVRLKPLKANFDQTAVHRQGGWCGDKRLLGTGDEHVFRLFVFDRDFLGLE